MEHIVETYYSIILILIAGSIVCILFCIVLTGLTVTFSFHALLDNFNGNCVSGVSLVFVHRDEVANATGETPLEDTARFSYRRLQQQQQQSRSRNQNFSDQLRQHFEPNNDLTEEHVLKLKRRLNEEDLEFFESRKINLCFFCAVYKWFK